MGELEDRKSILAKKYSIDFDALEREQVRLAKGIILKNTLDLSEIKTFGAVETTFIGNQILACFIVCDRNYEVIDSAYDLSRLSFPYFPGFRSYRELPAMIAAFEKLSQKPDIVFIGGQGIIHPRLGLASHFGLSTGVSTIGVSDSLIDCEAGTNDKDVIMRAGKKVGNVLVVKEGSKPLYISPGHNINVEQAYAFSRALVVLPHKRPQPLHLASKYAKEVVGEFAPAVK